MLAQKCGKISGKRASPKALRKQPAHLFWSYLSIGPSLLTTIVRRDLLSDAESSLTQRSSNLIRVFTSSLAFGPKFSPTALRTTLAASGVNLSIYQFIRHL